MKNERKVKLLPPPSSVFTRFTDNQGGSRQILEITKQRVGPGRSGIRTQIVVQVGTRFEITAE